MPSYFRQVPDFEYVSRLPDARISDYINVKNLFKKGKLREDIFQNLAYFTKYKVRGDDRPDNVAFEIYGDSTLDWVVLLSNNILNVQTEWPLPQTRFDEFLLNKYGDYNTLYNGIHHYESPEIKNTQDVVIVAKGLQVESNFSINYYDAGLERNITQTNIAIPVTNYEYELKIEDDKRNIYLLKPQYLNIVYDDMDELMKYKKGSTQYKSETLKRADNIRLYQ
jgi:hypothetical protein